MTYKKNIHAAFTMVLVLAFLTGALSKLVPSLKHESFDKNFLIGAVTKNNYSSPAAFQITITAMQQSGFLVMIGCVQLLTCLLMVFPRTRLAGLLALLPMTFTIFMIQAIMNNSGSDTIKCACLLAVNCSLVAAYYKKLVCVWGKMA